MLIVDHAQKWIKVSDHTPLSECVDSVKVYAPYEKKHGPLVYYADLKQPSHWYGCFPEGFDPRD